MGWETAITGLASDSAARLAALPLHDVARGTVLFRQGDAAEGFVVLLEGRIEVFLTGPSGREILLYAVEPGQSCVQTTLGLMGDDPYAGEALTATDVRAVIIPKPLFLGLMDRDAAFRGYVMRAFGQRMQDVTRLLERVAFGRVEARLAEALLTLAENGVVHATQAELAARIGSAREVVTRRLDAFAKAGWVATDRGSVQITNAGALRQRAAMDM